MIRPSSSVPLHKGIVRGDKRVDVPTVKVELFQDDRPLTATGSARSTSEAGERGSKIVKVERFARA